MNLILKLTAVIFILISSSCDSAKSSASEASTEKSSEIMGTKMVNEGYVAGVVKYQPESKCVYVLIDEKTELKYDPINIDEEKFMSFKKDAEKVYFKYRALRMMNRCDDVQPIQIIALQPREN